MKRILGLKEVAGHSLYLGLPTVSLRNKRLQFGFLRDRVVKKLSCWQNRTLSAGGKEVLIKAVIQAIPTYTMTCFRVPESICDVIDRVCSRFWWGDAKDKERMHGMKWQNLCTPKENGGLGFWKLSVLNKALVAKQVWKIIQKPDSFLARVLKSKYFNHSSILEAKVGSNVSFLWRSICWSRSLISQGLRWKVGRGNHVRLSPAGFVDPIVNGFPCAWEPESRFFRAEYFISENRIWDREMLLTVFQPAIVKMIMNVPIERQGDDKCVWKFEEKGGYTVKSGYLAASGFYETATSCSSIDRREWKDLVWNLDIPPKMKVFLWRAFHDFLAMAMNLRDHHVPLLGICEFCRKDWGTTTHGLFICDIVRSCWKNTIFWYILKKHRGQPMVEMRRYLSKSDYEIWAVMVADLWRVLCRKKHEDNGIVVEISYDRSKNFLQTFHEARKMLQDATSLGVKVGERIWHPPKQGIYRLDVDASVNENESLFGVGAIVRDWNETLRASLAKPILQLSSVLEAEINAILYGVGLCLQEGLVPFVVYSDSLLAIRLIKEKHEGDSYFENELPPLAELANGGVICDFRHMYREANTVAHAVAHFGARCNELVTWNMYFPLWLEALV